MTKKEKENLLINVWNLAKQFKRMEELGDTNFLNGMWETQLVLLHGFNINFTTIQICVDKNMTYEEMKKELNYKGVLI